ncbi:MAG TPA: response regulator [Terriglobales bacterium]
MSSSALLLCGDAEAVQIFTGIFHELDISVECCADHAQAQERIAGHKFDVLMLDCAGDPSALRLISAARDSQPNQSSLVIAMVGNPAQSALALSAGANYVLLKPVLQEHIAQSRRAQGTRAGEERRGRPRVKVKGNANVSFAARDSVPVEITDLSESGVAVKSAVQFPATGKVYFQFFLPGADGPIPLSGEVMWQNAQRSGIRFASVPQASQRALKKWMEAQSPVAQITAPPARKTSSSENQSESLSVRLSARLGLLLASGNTRRLLPRYPCRIGAEVYRSTSRVPQRCNITDLNHEGCFIETSQPFPVNTALRLQVRAQGYRLSLEGQVRICHPGTGMGVKFTALPANEAAQLQQLIEFVQSQPQ